MTLLGIPQADFNTSFFNRNRRFWLRGARIAVVPVSPQEARQDIHMPS